MFPPSDRDQHQESVRVVVQVRPLLPFELAHNAVPTVTLSQTPPTIRLTRPLSPEAIFPSFDAVYSASPNIPPDTLYNTHVAPLVSGLFAGLNATVFAYGQTSAGKSYTMHHITTRVARHLFQQKRQLEASANITIRVGFVEIYCEKIRDLVDGTRAPLGVVNVQVRERRPPKNPTTKSPAAPTVFLDGARERCVTEESDLLQIIREGALVRQTASTGMNASSSRSHSIITITVQQEPLAEDDPKPGAPATGFLAAKLHLVDLAGSERAKRTAVQGTRFAEGIEINKGLFALAKVISTLADNASRGDSRHPKMHVPYRDSKLTRLLQDSLGGNARTLLVACVSPADTSREETLGTLRYAERAKSIRNKPKVNTERNSVEVSDLRASLARAKAEIASLSAENERLRRTIGNTTCPRPIPRVSTARTHSNSTDNSFTDSCPSPRLRPASNPVIVTRDDDDVNGLKIRIAELEGMLDRANLSASDRAALLGTAKDSERVSRSPLGKLKNVGLAALNHVDGSENKKSDSRSKSSHNPRRRMRNSNPESNSTASISTRKSSVTRAGSLKPALRTARYVQAEGGVQGIPCTTSRNVLPGLAQRRLPRRCTPERSHVRSAESRVDAEEDGREAESSRAEIDSDMALGLSSNCVDEMRRTFATRLRQAEDDKQSIDKQRIKLMREMAELQKKHEKEMEEMRVSHHVRVSGMRTKLADVKRIEAEGTRLLKLRAGSDAARKKLAVKVKAAERTRDEAMAKLAESITRAESAKRAMGKENREFAKTEKGLRAEMRKMELGKNRQDAVINRLRLDNEAMKAKLRDAGRQHVRRTKSGITPRTTSRATATCL